jgi:biopolymer transport protein ExbD
MTPRTLEQALQTLAAPLAGLFLVIALIAAAPGPPASGVRLDLLRLREAPFDCGDGRPVVIHFEGGGSVWINEENVGAKRTPQAVADIMANRAERAVFLLPGKEASVQQVADLADQLHSAVAALHIGVVTYSQQELLERESMERKGDAIKYVPIECMAWPR